MSNSKHPWDQIDRKLAALKSAAASQHLLDAFRRKLSTAQLTMKDGLIIVSADTMSVLFRIINRLLQTEYRTYRKVWRTQGKEETAEFIHTLYELLIVPKIQYYRGWMLSEFAKSAKVESATEASKRSMYEDMEQAANKCESEWYRRCEIHALQLRYGNSQTGNVNSTASTQQPIEPVPSSGDAEPERNEKHISKPSGLDKYGDKETAIVVSYQKDGQKNMRKLSWILADKAHLSNKRGQYKNFKTWFEKDPQGFTKHVYRVREKAKKKGLYEVIPAGYWRSYQ
jgi:hypothetical protein